MSESSVARVWLTVHGPAALGAVLTAASLLLSPAALATAVRALGLSELAGLLEGRSPGALPGPIDKAVHFALFFLLTPLAYRSLSRLARWLRPRWMTAGVTTAYAFLLEYLQSFQPLRFLDLWDALAGALGAATACVLLYLARLRLRPADADQSSNPRLGGSTPKT